MTFYFFTRAIAICCKLHTLSACQLFKYLGLLVNKKSVLIPCQHLEFLGFQLCNMTLRISVSLENISKHATQFITLRANSVKRCSQVCWKGSSHSPGFSHNSIALQFTMNAVLSASSHTSVRKGAPVLDSSPS